MRATDWEFGNRALIFGLIFGFSFPLYAFDQQNSAVTMGKWLASAIGAKAEVTISAIFLFGWLLLVLAALLRTWASSYLHSKIVYASTIKTASLVGDGPYRHVRNPLYLANVMMVIGVGFNMSRTGFLLAVSAMVVFCYRLIFREEAELHVAQGDSYVEYCKLVPRLWPAFGPRIPASGKRAAWLAGFKAELWFWLILAVFAALEVLFLFQQK